MMSVTSDMLSAWAGVLVVFGAAVLVALLALVWIVFFRKNARHRYRRRRLHRNGQQPLNPTLAEVGGLPPVRENGKSSEPQKPTLTSRS
jgi:hypothetical protein